MHGRCQTAARFRLSRKVPWLEPPSPVKDTPTWSVPRTLADRPPPQFIGGGGARGGGGDVVVGAQGGADAGGDRLLTRVQVDEPGDLAGGELLVQPLLELADGPHRPVPLQEPPPAGRVRG